MYFICARENGKVGIKDTKDGVVEYYTEEEAVSIIKQGIEIWGITFAGVNKYGFDVLSETILKIMQCETGTPVRLKLSKNSDYKQALYIGVRGDKYVFYDGSGFTGYYELSKDFILRNEGNIDVDLDNNDPVKVATLTKKYKEGFRR